MIVSRERSERRWTEFQFVCDARPQCGNSIDAQQRRGPKTVGGAVGSDIIAWINIGI